MAKTVQPTPKPLTKPTKAIPIKGPQGTRVHAAAKKIARAKSTPADCVSAPLLKGLKNLKGKGGPKHALLRHHAFALEVFTHGSVNDAYRNVYDHEGKRSVTVCSASAARVHRHPNVIAELARLKTLHAGQLAEQEKQIQAERDAATARAIATRDEVAIFYTDLMRASSSDFSKDGRHFITVTEKKILAPKKYDKDGEEIENPDADEEGYVTSVERTPPTPKDRKAAADSLVKLQGWETASDKDKVVADSLHDILTTIRSGG